jgi:aminoglycoside phosphotransferase (APT) family kinase protein
VVLTARNVAHYLVERRLFDQASLLESPTRINAGSGRHRNFKVVREEAPGFFVKQVRTWDATTQWTLRREASWYARLHEVESCAPLRPHVPAFHNYDDARSILVIELIKAASLLDTPAHESVASPAVATGLGELFALLHSISPPESLQSESFRFVHRYPGALTIDQRSDETEWTPHAEREVFELLDEHTYFAQQLAELREGWQFNAVIHCDFRWNNVLLESDRLRLIDWELVDHGDAAWDVGGVLQAWLSSWIRSMPQDARSADELIRAAAIPLETMHPAIAEFWRTYSSVTGADAAFLLRSVRYAAARLLQTAHESVQGYARLNHGALYRLQLASNLLREPEAALQDLFALR